MTLRIGLISDTHLPDYIEALPEAILDVFADVDLLLHAGDVRLLSVLDWLSINDTPVVAVLGNDEEIAETRAILPRKQLITVGKERIFLNHGDRLDPEAERATRADDRWLPKLQYWADLGKQHNASIVVTGHTHLPWALTVDDVLLINPGAVANAGFARRLITPSVAILELPSRDITFYEARTGAVMPTPELDVPRGYANTYDAANTHLIQPEAKEALIWAWRNVYPLSPETMRWAFRSCAAKCWRFEAESYGIADLVAALTARDDVPDRVFEALRANPAFAPYL